MLTVQYADFLAELDSHLETTRSFLDQMASQLRIHQEWLISQM